MSFCQSCADALHKNALGPRSLPAISYRLLKVPIYMRGECGGCFEPEQSGLACDEP